MMDLKWAETISVLVIKVFVGWNAKFGHRDSTRGNASNRDGILFP